MLPDHTGSLAPLHPISYTGSMARMLPLRTNDSMARLLSLSTTGSMAPLFPDHTPGSLARLHPILTRWLECFLFALTSSMARMLPIRITSWLVRPISRLIRPIRAAGIRVPRSWPKVKNDEMEATWIFS